MIGLFCFDGPLYKDKDGIYCNVTLTNEMFARYFCAVDKLYVVVRTFVSDKSYKELNMKPLALDNMEVIEVGNFNTIHGFLEEKGKFKESIGELLDHVDLIFARMPSQTSNVVLEVAQKKHKPYLVEVGGCAWDSFWNHGLLGKAIAPYMYLCARKNIEKATFATYVTKEFLQRRYPNKGITANCSNVYLPQVDETVLEERLDKIKRVDLTHPVFGQAVNSIDVKYKGEHLIIKAMKTLKKKGILAEFQVVGPGTGEFLKTEAKRHGVVEQLKIMGTLQKNEMTEWYKSIDVYTQPSKQEGLPRSVIEAMSVGCAAVGSKLAGIPELLDKECLFNPDKNDEIVNTLLWVLNRKNMEAQARVNFKKARKYDLFLIEERRHNIFVQYKEYVLRSKSND